MAWSESYSGCLGCDCRQETLLRVVWVFCRCVFVMFKILSNNPVVCVTVIAPAFLSWLGRVLLGQMGTLQEHRLRWQFGMRISCSPQISESSIRLLLSKKKKK